MQDIERLDSIECHNPTGPVQPYKVPFKNSITHDPSVDEMRVLVVQNGIRPEIDPRWRQDGVWFLAQGKNMNQKSILTLIQCCIYKLYAAIVFAPNCICEVFICVECL